MPKPIDDKPKPGALHVLAGVLVAVLAVLHPPAAVMVLTLFLLLA